MNINNISAAKTYCAQHKINRRNRKFPRDDNDNPIVCPWLELIVNGAVSLPNVIDIKHITFGAFVTFSTRTKYLILADACLIAPQKPGKQTWVSQSVKYNPEHRKRKELHLQRAGFVTAHASNRRHVGPIRMYLVGWVKRHTVEYVKS